MIVRAGVDDRDILAATGVRIQLVFVLVFALGAGLPASPALSAARSSRFRRARTRVSCSLAGGRDRRRHGLDSGAALGAVIIGLAEQLGSVYIPTYAIVVTFLIMVLVLALRPQGLLARR
jgi:Branched-chain amino acid ABC-type transport system, permease components